MTHEFFEVSGVQVREVRFNGETDLENRYAKVHPKIMAEGTVDVHVWLPPRKGADGKPIETSRLRFFTVPVGPKGPLVGEIARMIDEARLPTTVRIEAVEIPPEIKAMKKHADLDTFAPQCLAEFTADTSIEGKQAILARKCLTSPGKEALERMRVHKPELAKT